jgi:membrane dipeptidase
LAEPSTSQSGIPDLDPVAEARARALHFGALVVDACNTAEWDDSYIARLKSSGVRCTWKTLTSHQGTLGALKDIAGWLDRFDTHRETIATARTAAEIDKIAANGKIAVVYTFQHTRAFDEDLDLVRVFFEMGVRVVQLTYNTRCAVGDGCLERTDAGLSAFGLEMVAKLNDLGIVIDVAHAGPRTAAEAIDASTDPVVCSHANAYGLVPNPRNVRDELIRALAARGGVLGIDAYLPHLSADLDHAPSVHDMIAHVDHVVQLVGPKHVGFGLDLGEGRTAEQYRNFRFPDGIYPSWEQRQRNKTRGIERIERFVNMTRGLVARGYRDEDILDILGGNFLRVFRRVVE